MVRNYTNNFMNAIIFWGVTVIMLGTPAPWKSVISIIMIVLCAIVTEKENASSPSKWAIESLIDSSVAIIWIPLSKELLALSKVENLTKMFSIPHAELLISFLLISIVALFEVTKKKKKVPHN